MFAALGPLHLSRRTIVRALATAALTFLALFNLSEYPTTWFDEGSHLQVPQTVVRFGEYAAHSSDGFRYYGPTIGVGPTVLLPIAAVYKLLGIGLLQARLVMAVYLVGAVCLFYVFARRFAGRPVALLAIALLVSSPTVAFLETGRQVLGEVPALCFLLGGLLVWFSAWTCRGARLTLAGLLLGAAAVTKYQNLIVLTPALTIAWAANAAYYRTARHRVFLLPGLIVAATFAAWQAALVLYLGPDTAAENLVALREATQGAAAAFSPDAMSRALRELLSFRTYGGLLPVALLYGATCSVARTRQSQQWGILFLLVTSNLAWYALASIGWPRYAFTGLAIGSLLVARLLVDLVERLAARVDRAGRPRWVAGRADGLAVAVAGWTFLIIMTGVVRVVTPIVRPPYNAPAAMAAFLNREVPHDAVIETWEPELGALTTHNYHYPPARLLAVAVRHVWLQGASPRTEYDVLTTERPPYVLVGTFARWVSLYSIEELERKYASLVRTGGYELFRRKDVEAAVAPTQ